MAQKLCVVLAAGLGKRMRSNRHKVVHEVCGKPMIRHIVDEMDSVGFDRLFVVVGRLEEQVRATLGDRVSYVRQEEQLGTGHAVLQAAPFLSDGATVVILYGDSPLVSGEEIARLIRRAEETGGPAVLTAVLDDPHGYGRIVRDSEGNVARIVEEKDASEEEREIDEVNSGIYAFPAAVLKDALRRLTPDNAQREYLLTDCVSHIRAAGGSVSAVTASDPDVILNVNDRAQLASAERKLRRRILQGHMAQGVTVIDPDSTYVQADVEIGVDTVLLPGTHLEGRTVIGGDCVIGPDSRLVDATVADGARVEYSVVMESRIGPGTQVGPFAYIRPGCSIGGRVRIGDFVEIKNSVIGDDSKVSHLSYVGDSEVGAGVNVGCGVVTVNYDGFLKHRTVIRDGSFVGSNVNLVAPVELGKGAYVATGSTVTDNVPDGAFAIARSRQTTKLDYAAKLRERLRPDSRS